MDVLCSDTREIAAIYGPEESWSIEVGTEGIISITAYLEDDGTPWFAIYEDRKLLQRINSRYVDSVVYAGRGKK